MIAIVYIYQTRIPKYREAFFEHLMAFGEIDQIEYQIVASDYRLRVFKHESKMQKNVINIKTKRIRFYGRELHILKKMNVHKNASLVVCEYGLKNLLVYYLLFLKKPAKFAFWGHGQTTTRAMWNIENSLKRSLLNRADYFFAYTQSCSDTITSLGFRSDRIRIVNNSVDTTSLCRVLKDESTGTRPEILRSLGFSTDAEIVLYLGSFETDKRIDFLLDSFEELIKIKSDLHLIICSQDSLSSMSTRRLPKNVYFLGEADIQMKGKLGKICKAIFNPGRIGLIAVDSFALGLPIVTTKWNRHAPEYSYLQTGVNCLITEDNLQAFVEGCANVLDNEPFRTKLILGCSKSLEEFSVEKMARNFHLGVLNCLET